MPLPNKAILLHSITDYFISSRSFRNFQQGRKKKKIILPSDLNRGECYRWAYFTSCLIDSCSFYRTVKDTYTHAFLEIDGLFYDAECCNGVSTWKELPIFVLTAKSPWNQHWTEESIHKDTEEGFIKYWGFDPEFVKDKVKEFVKSKKLCEN